MKSTSSAVQGPVAQEPVDERRRHPLAIRDRQSNIPDSVYGSVTERTRAFGAGDARREAAASGVRRSPEPSWQPGTRGIPGSCPSGFTGIAEEIHGVDVHGFLFQKFESADSGNRLRQPCSTL